MNNLKRVTSIHCSVTRLQIWLITVQLAVIVRLAVSDNSTKEEIPTVLPLKGITKGGDIYDSFKESIYLSIRVAPTWSVRYP
jgi:hypothetical protein